MIKTVLNNNIQQNIIPMALRFDLDGQLKEDVHARRRPRGNEHQGFLWTSCMTGTRNGEGRVTVSQPTMGMQPELNYSLGKQGRFAKLDMDEADVHKGPFTSSDRDIVAKDQGEEEAEWYGRIHARWEELRHRFGPTQREVDDAAAFLEAASDKTARVSRSARKRALRWPDMHEMVDDIKLWNAADPAKNRRKKGKKKGKQPLEEDPVLRAYFEADEKAKVRVFLASTTEENVVAAGKLTPPSHYNRDHKRELRRARRLAVRSALLH